ncbi:MAG: response regulator [Candidatus Methanoperedens sp.]|nr:response regulator [Candidatus Methanoperedens sp.]
MKVLVVECNPDNMKLALEILNAQGYTAHGVVDGEAAIKTAEIEVYDLILMDIALPDIDGVEATKIIKSKPKYKDVPVIALTEYPLEENKKRFPKAGFVDYVSKPIDVVSFTRMIGKYRIKWYEKIRPSIKMEEWIKPTGLNLLDNIMGGGLFSGSLVYILSDPQIDSEVFLFHFTQPRKCFYIVTERESKYIIQEMEKLDFDISNIEFIDIFSVHHSYLVTETDNNSLEFVKSKLQGIKERDLTIIIDTFNFFPLLNEGRDSIKEFVNFLYNFAKNNNAIIYLLSLRNTIDSKIENEIMWLCDVIFDISCVMAPDKIINELRITKAKNINAVTDTIKFFIKGKVLIDSSKEIV